MFIITLAEKPVLKKLPASRLERLRQQATSRPSPSKKRSAKVLTVSDVFKTCVYRNTSRASYNRSMQKKKT